MKTSYKRATTPQSSQLSWNLNLVRSLFANLHIEDGVNIDNWTFDGLSIAVQEFITLENKIALQVPVKVEEEIKTEQVETVHTHVATGDFVDVNDTYISQFNTMNFEDCPKLEYRNFAPC